MRRSARIRNRSDTNTKEHRELPAVPKVQNSVLPWMWQGIPDISKKDIRFPHPQDLRPTLSTVLNPAEDQNANLALADRTDSTEIKSGVIRTIWTQRVTWKDVVQSVLNAAVIAIITYLLLLLCLTLWQDVEWERARQSHIISQDAAICAEEYHANACSSPIPFLKEQCHTWKLCKDSDTTNIKKTIIFVQLVAELLSEFVEGFFGRLSYKTSIFFCVTFVFRNIGNV